MPINIEGDLNKKVEIIRKIAEKYAKSKFIGGLINEIAPKGWWDIYFWVKEMLKYKREKPGQDELLTPPEALSGVYADCEDYAVLLGSLLARYGYPVRFRIISNGTYHIYPEIYVKGSGWIGLDATRGMVGKKIYPPTYHTVREVAISGILGEKEKVVEIGPDTPLRPGDRVRFIYKPISFIPDSVVKWMYEKITSIRHPNLEVDSIYQNDDGDWVVEVTVKKTQGPSQATITPVIIASSLAVAMVASYFALKRVEKVTKEAKVPITLYTVALVLGALAALTGKKK